MSAFIRRVVRAITLPIFVLFLTVAPAAFAQTAAPARPSQAAVQTTPTTPVTPGANPNLPTIIKPGGIVSLGGPGAPIQLTKTDLPIQQSLDCATCHDKPPTVIGGDDLPNPGFAAMHLPTRSWASWWEVNGMAYELKARQSRDEKIQPPTASEAVVKSLIDAAKSGPVEVRREAILALGKMKAASALPVLEQLTKDADSICALRAWAAIGLLDSSEAISFLAAGPQAPANRVGWTVGVGLLTTPTPPMWNILRAQAADTSQSPEAQRLALWALRIHRVEGTQAIFQKVIKTSADPFVVAEAIMGLSVNPGPNDAQDLMSLIRNTATMTALPAIAAARRQAAGARRDASSFPDPFNTEKLAGDATNPTGSTSGMAVIRDAALRSLAQFPSISQSDSDDLLIPMTAQVPQVVSGYHSGIVDTGFMPEDPISTASLGSPFNFAIYEDRLEVNLLPHDGSPDPLDRLHRAGRGYAAIAMGILLDRAGGGKQEVEQIVTSYRTNVDAHATRLQTNGSFVLNTQKYVNERTSPDEALVSHLRRPTEIADFRAACALAMAIGRQNQRIAEIHSAIASLNPGEEAVFGYGVLALGLMGDEGVLTHTSRQLANPVHGNDANGIQAFIKSRHGASLSLTDILSRRAAIDGMATLGDPRAIPLLLNQWGMDPAIDLEVARAIAWCHRNSAKGSGRDEAVEFGNALATLLSDKQLPGLSASAAASMGEMFQQAPPDRLSRLMNGETFLSRGRNWDEKGKVPPAAMQQQVLGLGNSFYYLHNASR